MSERLELPGETRKSSYKDVVIYDSCIVVSKDDDSIVISHVQFDMLATKLGYTKDGTLTAELAAAKENLEVANHLLQTEWLRNTQLEAENERIKADNATHSHHVYLLDKDVEEWKTKCEQLMGEKADLLTDCDKLRDQYRELSNVNALNLRDMIDLRKEVKRLREASRAVVDLALCKKEVYGDAVLLVIDGNKLGLANQGNEFIVLCASKIHYWLSADKILLAPPAAPDPVAEAAEYVKSHDGMIHSNINGFADRKFIEAAKLLAEKVGG